MLTRKRFMEATEIATGLKAARFWLSTFPRRTKKRIPAWASTRFSKKASMACRFTADTWASPPSCSMISARWSLMSSSSSLSPARR